MEGKADSKKDRWNGFRRSFQ